MVDVDKMRKGYQREQRGGEFFTLDVGETLLYIHPQCRADDSWEPTDGVNYAPVVVHFKVGKKEGMVVSLDPELNPIIEHPFVKRLLKKAKKRLTGRCPLKEALDNGALDDDEADQSRAQTRYLWGCTPLYHRGDSSEEWRKLPGTPSVLFAGKTIFDGIMELFFDNGDITDPNAAILCKIKRVGKDMSTKYTISADTASLKKPKALPPPTKAAIAKAIMEEGDCDLFRIVANMVKTPAEVEALLAGTVVSETPDDDWDDDDDEPAKPAKAKPKKPAAGDDDDDGEGDLDDEPAPKPAKPKKPADDDDDDLGLGAIDAELSRLGSGKDKTKGKK